MSLLQDFLVNASAGAGVEITMKLREFLAKEYFARDPIDRLLLLLEDEFGSRTGLLRDDFLAWRDDEALRDDLVACLERGGRGAPDLPGLHRLIEPLLIYTPDTERPEVAEAMVEFAWRSPYLTVDSLKEATEMVASRVGREGVETRRLLSDLVGSKEGRKGERLGEALLRGPLDHSNSKELIEEAQKRASNDPEGAARAMLKACERLRDAGLDAIAETYEEQAADLLVKGGQASEAARILTTVARARLRRGSEMAGLTVTQIKQLKDGKPEWLDGVFSAWLYWPIDPSGSAEHCLTVAKANSLDEEWFIDIFDLLLVAGSWESILELVAAFEGPVEQADFRIRLCVAEAQAIVSGDETEWARLIGWAQSCPEAEPAGLIWQRRGMFLAAGDEIGPAIAAYREAMAAWSRLDNSAEQVAEAYFCIQTVSLNAGIYPDDSDLRPLAAELRSEARYPAAKAERLEYWGMSQRAGRKLRDALLSFSRALHVHIRSGSIQGTLRLHERLGELDKEAGEPLSAIQHYFRAGKGDMARELAREVGVEQLTELIGLQGGRLQRVAEYSVIAEIGEELSEVLIRGCAAQIFADAERPFSGWLGPDLSAAARRALFAVSLKLEGRERQKVLELMLGELSDSFVDISRAAARALALGTDLGLWDATESLIEAFIKDPGWLGLNVGWVAERAIADPRVVEALRAAALSSAGSIAALEALAIAQRRSGRDLVSGDRQLVALCSKAVSSRRLSSVKKTPAGSGHNAEVSIDIGVDLSATGLLASFAGDDVRDEVVVGLLAVIEDDQEPENHRSSAVAALFELVPALSETEGRLIVDALNPISNGSYRPSPWDGDSDHPYSAVRISIRLSESLRAAALQCVGRIVSAFPSLREPWLGSSTVEALQSAEPLVIRAGLSVADDLKDPDLLPLIEPHLGNPSAQVRAAALDAWVGSKCDLPVNWKALADDSAPVVRMAAVEVAKHLPEGRQRQLLAVLSEDPDPVIARRATELQSGPPMDGSR